MFRFLHGLERAFCRRALANTLICGVLYFTLAVGVNGVSESWKEATSFWPAAGLALVGFLLRGPVLIPGIALANAASGGLPRGIDLAGCVLGRRGRWCPGVVGR